MTNSMLLPIHIINSIMIYGPNNWQKDFYATLKIDQKYFPPCWIENSIFQLSIVLSWKYQLYVFLFVSPFNFCQIKVFNWMLNLSKNQKLLMLYTGTQLIEIVLSAIDCCWMVKFWLNDSNAIQLVYVCSMLFCYRCVCIKALSQTHFSLRFSIFYSNLLYSTSLHCGYQKFSNKN